MQKQLISLFVVLLTLFICSQAQTCGGSNDCGNGGDTNINFYFADMLAGANQGSSLPSSPSTGNSTDSYDESGDAFCHRTNYLMVYLLSTNVHLTTNLLMLTALLMVL